MLTKIFQMLDFNTITDILIVASGPIVLGLIQFTRQSTNKVVRKEGPMVVATAYEKFGELVGLERKKKAKEHLKQLVIDASPSWLKPFIIAWFQFLGSREAQKAYDDYWERHQQEIIDNYQWKGNVYEEET